MIWLERLDDWMKSSGIFGELKFPLLMDTAITLGCQKLLTIGLVGQDVRGGHAEARFVIDHLPVVVEIPLLVSTSMASMHGDLHHPTPVVGLRTHVLVPELLLLTPCEVL